MPTLFNKGQVTMLGGAIIEAITMIGSIFTARVTSNSAITSKIAEVNTAAAVISTRVESNEKVSTDRLNRLEDKIDWLIRQQGGVPGQIIQSR